MKYIIGKDRNQFEMFCLEERIEKDNEVLPSSSMAADHTYNISEFLYNEDSDTYTCHKEIR